MTDKDNIEEDYLNDLLNSLISEELGDNDEPAMQEQEENEDMQLLDHEMLNGLFEEPLSLDENEEVLSSLDERELSENSLLYEVNNEPVEKMNFISRIKQKLFSKNKAKEAKEKMLPKEEISQENSPIEKKVKVKKVKEKKVKEKKVKEKKVKEVNPEMNESIKISFIGILFAITFMVGVFVIVSIGGNFFYNKRMEDQAVDYYTNKQYKEAYNSLSGLKDIESDQLYQQLKLIMEVNKDYETYKNLKLMGRNAEALDYLIRGIADYDHNQEIASEMGVLEDFNLILGLINKGLTEDYQLSESEAREISHILNKQEYSNKIRSIEKN